MHKDKRLEPLLEYARRRGFTISFVDNKTLHDYAGMNPEAAKIMGYHDIKTNEIQLDRHQSVKTQFANLKHEIIERDLMKAGQTYFPSHVTALKLEKAPITSKEIDTLARLGKYQVTHIHDDGDLTVKSGGKAMVVTTEGRSFIEDKEESVKWRPIKDPSVKWRPMPKYKISSVPDTTKPHNRAINHKLNIARRKVHSSGIDLGGGVVYSHGRRHLKAY